jgi:lauroyl/myristoyl acyltransferase
VLSPEGTRSRIEKWRTGFWWIANETKSPIIPVAFDFKAKEFHFHPPFHTTGDVEADVQALRKLFRAEMAHTPAKYVE